MNLQFSSIPGTLGLAVSLDIQILLAPKLSTWLFFQSNSANLAPVSGPVVGARACRV